MNRPKLPHNQNNAVHPFVSTSGAWHNSPLPVHIRKTDVSHDPVDTPSENDASPNRQTSVHKYREQNDRYGKGLPEVPPYYKDSPGRNFHSHNVLLPAGEPPVLTIPVYCLEWQP